MIPSPSARFTAALRKSHRRVVRVTIWKLVNTDEGGESGSLGYVADGEFQITQGRLVHDADAQVRRRFSAEGVVVGSSASDAERLTTHNTELQVEVGIQYAENDTEWVTIARTRLEEADNESGKVGTSISSYDRSMRITDFALHTFYAPQDLDQNKLTHLAAIQDLVTITYPTGLTPEWVIDPSLPTDTYPPDGTVFEGSRWDAIDALAEAIGAEVYNDHEGRWVIAAAGTADPVWTIDQGEGGVLMESSRVFSRSDQYNAVALTCEPAGGDVRAFLLLVDTDPESPTFWDGPFGRKPKVERNDTILDGSEADNDEIQAKMVTAGQAILDRYSGRTSSLSLEAIANPLLEPGDSIEVHVPTTTGTVVQTHVIDSLTLDLTKAGMSIETRIVREAGA